MSKLSVTFVICFHSIRLSNLQQTIRFLEKREPELRGSDLVLACQDKVPKIESDFFKVKQYNFGIENYHKSFMTNIVMKEVSSHISILLDSDRVLPQNYFTKMCRQLKPRELVTLIHHYNLQRDYTDEEIESNSLEKKIETRSPNNIYYRKNMFSGNTIMWTSDYHLCGGMDEHYIGYGFADTDMTENAKSHGLNLNHIDDKEIGELHLFHPKIVVWRGMVYSDLLIMTTTNGMYYCKKWQKPYDERLNECIKSIMKSLDKYPEDLREKFLKSLNSVRIYL